MLTVPRGGGTPHHAGPPGLIRRQREWRELWIGAFIGLSAGGVTKQGPGAEWVCLGPAVVCGFLTLYRKNFTAAVQVTIRM